MRYLIAAAALALLAVPAHAGSGNPLIGSWQYVSTTKSGGASACSTIFVFAEKMATITEPATSTTPQGSTRRLIVGYIIGSPNFVAVTTDGNMVNYNVPDSHHMYTEDPWGKCNYVRTN
jgi:hypothetical protein